MSTIKEQIAAVRQQLGIHVHSTTHRIGKWRGKIPPGEDRDMAVHLSEAVLTLKMVERATPEFVLKSALTPGQRRLMRKHGTPATFSVGCYQAVPEFISMDEARTAIEKYNAEWRSA